MAKKHGVNLLHKQTNKKRPGVHSKRRNKRKPNKKQYNGQGKI